MTIYRVLREQIVKVIPNEGATAQTIEHDDMTVWGPKRRYPSQNEIDQAIQRYDGTVSDPSSERPVRTDYVIQERVQFMPPRWSEIGRIPLTQEVEQAAIDLTHPQSHDQ